MDRLWAPWRIDYVGVDDQEAGCFLCNAAARPQEEQERHVVWRGDLNLCVLNRWPYNNGHVLIAPLAHKADLEDLTEDELTEQMALLRRCKRALSQVMNPQGFNIGLNLGQVAGAGVPGHMHWHIVPRWDADTNFMAVTADTRVIPQSLGELWTRLRAAEID